MLHTVDCVKRKGGREGGRRGILQLESENIMLDWTAEMSHRLTGGRLTQPSHVEERREERGRSLDNLTKVLLFLLQASSGSKA